MRNIPLYIISLCLICWSVFCGFRIIELVDVYKIVLGNNFSLYSILFVEFSVFYELIICLFLGIVLNTNNLESVKYESIWILSFTYVILYLFLFFIKNDEFYLYRFNGAGSLFILGFSFNIIVISIKQIFSFKKTILFVLISALFAFSLIRFNLFL
jgi:hypothetical protein